jgi:hypothetical protein
VALYIANLSDVSGWTERWNTTEGSFASTGGNLRITKTGETNTYGVSWNTIDADADRDEVEVLAKVRFTTQASAGALVGIFARGSGITSSRHLIVSYLASAGNVGSDVFQLYSIITETGNEDNDTLTGRSNEANIWYWMRLRISGTTAISKVWKDGDVEPDWQLTVTTTITAAGWVGVYGFDTATDPYDIGYFAVATNGDSIGSSSSRVQFIGI